MIYNEDIKVISLEEIRKELEIIRDNADISTQRRFRKKGVKWYNIPCGFDIETTNTVIDGKKVCWIYELTFGIGDKIYLMRTIYELLDLCKLIQEVFKLDDLHRIACYIHNTPFEFQFIRKKFNFTEVFAIDSHRPIRFLCDLGIEFRDSAILSASSLDTLAKNLHSHTIKKLVGDLDYDQIRTSETELTYEEWQYCINDVKILLYYIEEQIEEYRSIYKIPMTNTGRVRNYCRENCLYIHNEKGERILNKHGTPMRNWDYIGLMEAEVLTDEIYDWCKKAFRGGFTHANARKVGFIIPNVGSYDLTSAYPSMIVSKRFPSGTPAKFYPESKQHFLNALKCRACLFYVEFDNIRRKPDAPDSYISWIPNKMNGVNINNDDNGRIVSANKLGMWMTEIDWDIISKLYDWDDFHYGEYMYVWFKERLPVEIVNCVLKFYKDKTELKGVKGREIDYARSKGMLNSIYGMMVQDPMNDNANYEDDEWIKQVSTYTINDINNKQGRFTYYPVGIWITAYCRSRIWDAILAAGKSRQCYTDTDSIKVERWWELSDWFKNYNKQIRNEMYEAMDYYKLPHDLVEPMTIKGVRKLLGEFDYEGCYGEFKTLGAKRYMTSEPVMNTIYSDNNDNIAMCLRKSYSITVAGLPKCSVDWFTQFDDPFNAFKDNCEVPISHSRKLLHTFIEEEWCGCVTDYQGNTSFVSTDGGVHLQPIGFNMNITEEFNKFMAGIQTDEFNRFRWY